jgi:hypothetical protein
MEYGPQRSADRGLGGGATAQRGARTIGSTLGTHNLAFERLAEQRLPFVFLLVGQHAERLLVGGGAQLFELLAGRGSITASAASAGLEGFAQLRLRALLNALQLVLLVAREIERRGHFGIFQRHRAALLQADLLESFELIFFQDRGERGLIGLLHLGELGLPFFAAEIAQAAGASSLLFELFSDLLRLIVGKLELGLDRFLSQQAQGVEPGPHAAAKAAAALSLCPGTRRSQRHQCEHKTQITQLLHRRSPGDLPDAAPYGEHDRHLAIMFPSG